MILSKVKYCGYQNIHCYIQVSKIMYQEKTKNKAYSLNVLNQNLMMNIFNLKKKSNFIDFKKVNNHYNQFQIFNGSLKQNKERIIILKLIHHNLILMKAVLMFIKNFKN